MDIDYCNCEKYTSIVFTEDGFICGACGKTYEPLPDGQKKIIESLACKFDVFVRRPYKEIPGVIVVEELKDHRLGTVSFSRE